MDEADVEQFEEQEEQHTSEQYEIIPILSWEQISQRRAKLCAVCTSNVACCIWKVIGGPASWWYCLDYQDEHFTGVCLTRRWNWKRGENMVHDPFSGFVLLRKSWMLWLIWLIFRVFADYLDWQYMSHFSCHRLSFWSKISRHFYTHCLNFLTGVESR